MGDIMKNPIYKRLILIFVLAFLVYIYISDGGFNNKGKRNLMNEIADTISFKRVEVEKITINSDKDNDGILDLEDIVQGARQDAEIMPVYKDAYYSGGYPPDNEGVCTDVVWRAFKNAGYDLKKLLDQDIKNNIRDYPRIEEGKPDPNIDFRRVKNLIPYFKKYATILTTEVKPYDVENLKEWQGGDIVVFDDPYEHIGIISDKRRVDGVPYMIHNGGPYTKEEDALLYWDENISDIIWHFRFPK